MGDDILSVGVDIGTSTTQVIFSRLRVENTANYFTIPRATIVDKEVVYKSPVHLTPLVNESLLDGDAVRALVEGDFRQAGFRPGDTGTGAVIITGESARKENSRLVLEKLSGLAGDFVVATAGPDLEAIIAGKGSGAQAYSEQRACTVMNLDIGGGTTNLALFDQGDVIAKGCLDIGGRLVRLAPDGTVLSISPPAAAVAQTIHLPLEVGKRAEPAQLEALTGEMAHLLEQQMGLCPQQPLLRQIETPGATPCVLPKAVQAICFSGGVADLIYRAEETDPLRYGDIGVYLGRAIRQSRLLSAFRLVEPEETIRATVVGAGTYTTTLSGSTIHYSRDVFPLKNIPVVRVSAGEQERCFQGDSSLLETKLRWFIHQSDAEYPALVLPGKKSPAYRELEKLAHSLSQAAAALLPPTAPLLLVIETDMAKALGQCVSRLAPERTVVAIDSIKAGSGDYLDLGRPLLGGMAIPVVVKTLIFG
ncbi:ethanolamine ammonia-lyase reactivating factor EutA [Angelakisella massiliensis]|uniref:ethanolamine ammonia-lyase reactivating factor EutA n=1 Tax=Angelakisella massiliensis TaxID=1871018 RepID=UPI0023A8C8EB|nr:ethanolamine ammonia-lyase reactivating factor EutA [Angelakisella massiliensis]